MKCTLVVGALLATSFTLPAQPPGSQQQPPQQQQQQQQQQPGYPPGGAPGVSRPGDPTMNAESMATKVDDKTFLKRAATADIMQMELGKLAAEKGSSDAVREFGRKMADDRQKANEEVMQLAAKQGVSVSDSLDPKHKGKVDKLAKLEGTEFDKAFLKEQTHDNHDDIAQFQAEAQGGSDAAVKSFATRILPMMQSHEQQAKNLEQQNNKK